jgi:hypothetical protein
MTLKNKIEEIRTRLKWMLSYYGENSAEYKSTLSYCSAFDYANFGYGINDLYRELASHKSYWKKETNTEKKLNYSWYVLGLQHAIGIIRENEKY